MIFFCLFKQWQSEASNYLEPVFRPIVCTWIVTALTLLVFLLLFIHWHLIHRGNVLRRRNEIWAYPLACFRLMSTNFNYCCLWELLPGSWHHWRSFSLTAWRKIVWKSFSLKTLNKMIQIWYAFSSMNLKIFFSGSDHFKRINKSKTYFLVGKWEGVVSLGSGVRWGVCWYRSGDLLGDLFLSEDWWVATEVGRSGRRFCKLFCLTGGGWGWKQTNISVYISVWINMKTHSWAVNLLLL